MEGWGQCPLAISPANGTGSWLAIRVVRSRDELSTEPLRDCSPHTSDGNIPARQLRRAIGLMNQDAGALVGKKVTRAAIFAKRRPCSVNNYQNYSAGDAHDIGG